jgi:hypothetical protein
VAPLRQFKKQPRWLPLMHQMFCCSDLYGWFIKLRSETFWSSAVDYASKMKGLALSGL